MTAKELSGVVPPTAPVNVVVAALDSVNALAPFNVLPNEMPRIGFVIVLVPVKLTGSGKMSPLFPLTEILLPIWIKPALVNTRLVSDVTAPAKATVPVPATNVKLVAPVTELENEILAPPLVRMGVLLKVTVPVIPIGPLAVVILPPNPMIPV